MKWLSISALVVVSLIVLMAAETAILVALVPLCLFFALLGYLRLRTYH